MSMGTGSAQPSFLSCFPLHLGRADPFHICQRQLPMAFRCIYITATTPVAATSTRTHTLIIALDSPPLSQRGPGPAESDCHTRREWKCSKFESAGSHCHFSPRLRLITHTFLKQIFPKLSRFLQQLKHFPHSLFLSSPSFWQEARPCWSGRLSVPGPKLTQPIGGGNHDLTNKRNRGLQQGGRLGFEEQ